jgi:hypothetical protein
VVAAATTILSWLASLAPGAAGPPAASEWVALRDAGLPLRALQRAVRAGELSARRIGRALYVQRAALDAWTLRESERAGRARTVAEERRQRTRSAAPRDELERAVTTGRLRLVPAGDKGTR